MKLGLLGDAHLTNKSPQRRIDDWWGTQKRKLNQSIDIFKSRGCDAVLQAGDLVDSPNVSNVVISEVIDILNGAGIVLNMVAGNHCLFGHSMQTVASSPLSVFRAAGVINILGAKPTAIGDVFLYGASFGEKVPNVETNGYNVLVAHVMVGDRPLFPDQELENPLSFLTQNPQFNLILVGDYHYRFISRDKNRAIVNCGALVRKSISPFDLEHEPAVVIIDTTSNDIEVVKLDIEPVEKVFDTSTIHKRDDSKLNRFIEDLRNQQCDKKSEAGWKQKLIETMNKLGASQEVRQIIDKAMEEVNK